MNETYVECMVAHKKNPLADVFKYLMYALALIALVGAAAFNSLLFVAGVAFALLAYFVSPMLDIEYEYLYIDKSITIDKVLAKEKRKKVCELDLNKMEIMAPVKSHELDSYRAQKLPYVEYASGNENANVYVIVYADGESRRMIGIEPNEEMLKVIKNYFPRKVSEY